MTPPPPEQEERERALAVLDTMHVVTPIAVFQRFKPRIQALRQKIADGADLHSPEIQEESANLQSDMARMQHG